MPLPESIASVVSDFAAALAPVDPRGLYVGGSLASGDFVPGVSDLDLVALVDTRLDDQQRLAISRVHHRLRDRHHLAAKLHCLYVSVGDLADPEVRHGMWDGRKLTDRAFTGVARAELLRGGITIVGGEPDTLIPWVDDEELRVAVRQELSGYWATAADWRVAWLRDLYVDLGLLTLPRAEAALKSGELISKRQALDELASFGVPAQLVDEIRRRRSGERTPTSPLARLHRARTARTLVNGGIRRLLIAYSASP